MPEGAGWLVGGGEMGRAIRSMDWSRTPLGPIDGWPQSLRTTVSLCLASNFPISLAWGPHHIQIYNDGYWPICGAKHPQSMGQDFSECWASAWPAIGAAFERALAGETTYLENQRMFLDRNGYLEETFFTFSFSPVRDEANAVGGLFHPVTETTAKMLSERRTRALRDLSARAGKAQSTEEALILAAETLQDYDLDIPFARFYQLEPERLIAPSGKDADGRDAWPLMDVAARGEVLQVDDVQQIMGTIVHGPYPEPPKTALALPITPPGCERPVAVVIVGVSSRLPLDEAYRAFFDLLAAGITMAVANARAHEQERKRTEALAEIDRAKTAFFSNVSHEFRTPLTLMLGPLEEELAEKHTRSAATQARLETAHRNSLRLLKLVNALLEFSRIEAGRVEASYEPTDLAALTGELASTFRSAIERAGLTLEVDCPPLPEALYVDREMWEKVVLNLLSNALKHTFEGSVRVVLRWSGDSVELSVADSGIGIASTEVPRLFDRFHRVKGARSRSHEGTGIGLALVRELVALHGGTVRVESEEGKGSTFAVSLKAGYTHLPPDRVHHNHALHSASGQATAYIEEAMQWLPSSAPSVAGPPASAGVGEDVSRTRQRPRILWADDNADLRNYVARLLEPYYDVDAVADGSAALREAQRRTPDLVLSDVMMPGLDGFQLLRALRGRAETRTIPVILLSARAGEESSIEGLEAGADDYLVKPFSARELLARVRTHLEMARVRRQWADELAVANAELEAFSYAVSHDLRAPLRAIDGFTQLLARDCAEAVDLRGKGHIDRILGGAERMRILIDALLELSRITRADVRKKPVDLSDLAADIVEGLRQGDPSRAASVTIEPNLVANGDRTLLHVVLTNLIGNAWKYSSRTEAAHIEFGRTPGGDGFYVRDNGAGFDMAFADRLFKPFQRLHHASDFSGTGIGLATVHRVIARHGGRVWAESIQGGGATFFFSLPPL